MKILGDERRKESKKEKENWKELPNVIEKNKKILIKVIENTENS